MYDEKKVDKLVEFVAKTSRLCPAHIGLTNAPRCRGENCGECWKQAVQQEPEATDNV